jgi:hypothetical protein
MRSAPHTPGSPSRLRFQALRRFHGLHPEFGGSALPAPALAGETSNDAAGFASCYGPHRRSPCYRASDAGLRPGPFPGRAASLLPGLLAATRTGLTPAGDDELTNSKIRCYITASPPALLGARTIEARRPSIHLCCMAGICQPLAMGTGRGRNTAGRRSPARRTGLILAALMIGAAAAMILIGSSFHHGVWPFAVAFLPAAPGFWIAWSSYRDDRRADDRAISLDEHADMLATQLETDWSREAGRRGLNDPSALPVSWTAAASDLTDSWETLETFARGSGPGWATTPERTWASRSEQLAGHSHQLSHVLRSVPTGRLLILGEPGCGKTMLLVRLVLDMLAERRQASAPIPFLVSLASWSPDDQDLHGWLADQLVLILPGLEDAFPGGNVSRAQKLLADHLVVPLLDGLDEVPEPARKTVVTKLNDELRAREPIVVTCRSEEYRNLVFPPDKAGVHFYGAAAIEVLPLSPDRIANYLQQKSRNDEVQRRWSPVIEALGTNMPVAQALTTPLMVGLASAIYNPAPGDQLSHVPAPADLVDSSLVSRADVEALLIRGLVPASYRTGRGVSGDWTAAQVTPWLAYLAHRQQKIIRGPDIAWWRLAEKHNKRSQKPAESPDIATPARGVRFRPWNLIKVSATGVALGALMGAVLPFGEIDYEVGDRVIIHAAAYFAEIVAFTLLTVLLFFPVSILASFEGVPDNLERAVTPSTVLARDRRAALLIALPGAIAIIPVFGILEYLNQTSGPGGTSVGSIILSSLTTGPVVGACVGLFAASYTAAWPAYMRARLRLALRHRLPWNLMGFLDDAHQRGILRQAGPVYQFRHNTLQIQLATLYTEPPLRTWQRRLRRLWKAGISAGDTACWLLWHIVGPPQGSHNPPNPFWRREACQEGKVPTEEDSPGCAEPFGCGADRHRGEPGKDQDDQ